MNLFFFVFLHLNQLFRSKIKLTYNRRRRRWFSNLQIGLPNQAVSQELICLKAVFDCFLMKAFKFIIKW
jgi:hypothetical protein